MGLKSCAGAGLLGQDEVLLAHFAHFLPQSLIFCFEFGHFGLKFEKFQALRLVALGTCVFSTTD